MIQPSDIFTLTDFKRKSTELIERLHVSGRPQVLTVEGLPKVVVMGVEAFERMAELAERADTVARVRQGIADVEAGRTLPVSAAFDAIHRAVDRPRNG